MPRAKSRGRGKTIPRKDVTIRVDSESDDVQEVTPGAEKSQMESSSRERDTQVQSSSHERDISPVSQGSQGSSTSQKSSKREYHKAELSIEQEVELMEWYREQECLYNKKHRDNLNTKHKNLIKSEQAEKMKITGEFEKPKNFNFM